MNYYEHHIGDYAEATAHLSFVEDSAYARLMRKCYATERALPADIKEVQRLAGCRSTQERQAVERVLKEFFILKDDGWHQHRCDEEIARYQAKRESAKASAGVRWNRAPKHANASETHMRNDSERNANALPTQCEGNALQSPVSIPHPPDLRKESEKRQTLSSKTSEKAAEVSKRPKIKTVEEFSKSVEIIRSLCTTGGAEPIRTPAVQHAIDASGGWPAFTMADSYEMGILEKKFVVAYREYLQTNVSGFRVEGMPVTEQTSSARVGATA